MRVLSLLVLLAACLIAGCNNATFPARVQSGTLPATAPATTTAATAPAPLDLRNVQVTERIVDEPGRRVVRLANGLTVILQENHTVPVVATRIYVKAGSLTEQEYMGTGISHVLEHLVAGGSSVALEEAQSQQALRILGGDSNAFTSFDQTCYFITTTSEKWHSALSLLANWTTRADFTDAQFRREYQVVQREIEMGESEALRTFFKATYANRYLVSPVRHPVIGYKPAFQKLTVQDCRTYYTRMYVPDNMIVSIAGALDMDDALAQVQHDFAHVERKKVPSIALPPEPLVLAPRLSVNHADIKQARVQWAYPSVDMHDPDMYALDVLATILGGGDSSILVRSLRDEQQLVTSIGVADDTPAYVVGSLEFTAELPPRNIAAARRALLDALETIKTTGATPAQIEKAKAQFAADLVYGNQTAEAQASRNAEDFLATGDATFSKTYIDRVNRVTPEQVRDAARKYIKPETMLTTILLPLGAPDALAGLQTAAGAAAETKPQTELVKLPNGLRVLICRNPAAPVVAIEYYALGGLLAETEANSGIGNAMAQLLPRGTSTHSHEQIAEFLDSTGGELGAVMGNNTFGLHATALKQNADKTFEIFADLLQHPAFAPDQLDQIRPQLLAHIEHATEDWFGEAYAFLRANYFQVSPYKRLPTGSAAVVAQLTPAQLREHYERYMLDPTHAVLAVYGDIDPAAVRAWIEPLGRIPAPATPPAIARESTATPARTLTQKTDKKTATILIGYGPGMLVDSPDRYPMRVLQTILGGYNSPGGSVLHETLRGQGLVYTVQASAIIGPVPGMFLILALGQPENSDRIVNAISKIVADARAGKFTDAQVATAKDQIITGDLLRDQTVADQAASAALDELLGLGYQARSQDAAAIAKVTRADVQRVAEHYLQSPVVTVTTPAK